MIYLDNAATTRVLPEAAKAAADAMTEGYANPGSLHEFGFQAEKIREKARKSVADAAGVLPEEIYFTPSATIANNAVLRGILATKRSGRILTTAFEHPAVEEVLKAAEANFEVVRIPPEHGQIRAERFREALTPDTVLITCMQVNNETGAVTPLKEIAQILRRSKIPAPIHSDAVQGFLKEDFRYSLLDAATFAGHKIHAPKGIGVLYLKKGTRIRPIFFGGGQEKGIFSGTENLPAIAALGVCCDRLAPQKNEEYERIRILRDRLKEGLISLGAEINSPENASPYLLNVAFPGYPGENILHFLSARGIYISTGSACSSKKASRVMSAIGKAELTRYALRFSLSRETEADEIDETLAAVADALRSLTPEPTARKSDISPERNPL